MYVRAYAHALETVTELVGGVLSVVVGDDHRAYHEVAALELLPQAEHVFVVRDAQISSDLVFLDVLCADDDDYLDLLAQLGEHAQLRVGLEAGQDARGMVVVEELATEFHVKLAVELRDALADVFRLYPQVLVVVETYFHLTSCCCVVSA